MKKRGLNLPKERVFTGPALIYKRIGAFFMDLLVIEFILALPFQSIIKKSLPSNVSYKEAYNFFLNNPSFTTLFTLMMILLSILGILYFAILEYKFGQTIGKIFMNIKVVSENKKLLFWQCLARSLFLLPVFPFFVLWIGDPLFLFFRGQRLSELLTKTKVVEDYIIG